MMAGHLVIGKTRDYRSDQNSGGNAGRRKLFNCSNASIGLRRTRLQLTGQASVECSHRNIHNGSIVSRESRQHIDIASDQLVLCNDDDRVQKFYEHFQATARESKPALNGLECIGLPR